MEDKFGKTYVQGSIFLTQQHDTFYLGKVTKLNPKSINIHIVAVIMSLNPIQPAYWQYNSTKYKAYMIIDTDALETMPWQFMAAYDYLKLSDYNSP